MSDMELVIRLRMIDQKIEDLEMKKYILILSSLEKDKFDKCIESLRLKGLKEECIQNILKAVKAIKN